MCCLKWSVTIISLIQIFKYCHTTNLKADEQRSEHSNYSHDQLNRHVHTIIGIHNITVLDTSENEGSLKNASPSDKVNYSIVPDLQPNEEAHSTWHEQSRSEFKSSAAITPNRTLNTTQTSSINEGRNIYSLFSSHSNPEVMSSSDHNKQKSSVSREFYLPSENSAKLGNTELSPLSRPNSSLDLTVPHFRVNVLQTTPLSSDEQTTILTTLVSNTNIEQTSSLLSEKSDIQSDRHSPVYSGSEQVGEQHKANHMINISSSSHLISDKTSQNNPVHTKDQEAQYVAEDNKNSYTSIKRNDDSSIGVDRPILLKPQVKNIQRIPSKSVISTGDQPPNKEVTTYHPNDVIHAVPDVYRTEMFHNMSKPEKHPCARTCTEGMPIMDCHYKFELEWYYTMSKACYNCPLNLSQCDLKDCVVADGVKRPIAVVNRQMPGPSVEVCKGDHIIVDLENHLMEESTTIHWHGHHQRGTPYMDGVPFVTQCPIPPKSSFRYHYIADTPGTHFWHSHSGCQRADGVFGALIVHVPASSDPHSQLYDLDLSEHIVQILDWDHQLGVQKFLAHHHANGDNKPETLLVNGRGRFHQFEDVHFNVVNVTRSPTATFTVQQGFRYRFRLINAGFLNCPIEMSVDNHTLVVISSDGADIKPVEANSLVSYAGERFDFILNANKKVGNYWMRFRGLMDCDERFKKAHQVAVLHYEGASERDEPPGEVSYEAARREGLQVNSLNVGSGSDGSLVIPELDALVDDDETVKEKPDMIFYLSYDFYKLDNPHYHRSPFYGFQQVQDDKERLLTPQLNHISLKLPPFPLLSQYKELGSQYPFCNDSTMKDCEHKYCECTHVIEVPLGSVLELILIDKGKAYDANHPFHLHGHAFRVIAMERLGKNTTVKEVKQRDDEGLIHRKLSGAPIKDTITVPDGGFTIVRVHASNPGYWLFHCHIEFHVEVGMALVFKVGQDEDFPPIPSGFPRCNSYMPPEKELYNTNSDIDNEIKKLDPSHSWPLRSPSNSGSSFNIFLIPIFVQLSLHVIVR